VEQVYVRGDSALYEHEVLDGLAAPGAAAPSAPT